MRTSDTHPITSLPCDARAYQVNSYSVRLGKTDKSHNAPSLTVGMLVSWCPVVPVTD